jgi:hypothetical protein
LLFTFKFDYIWGGAEIVPFGETSQYEIKGRWFKPGTRLVDQDDCDLIITEKKDNCLEVTLCEENISNTMMLATIYYHVYTSRGKMLSIII